MVNPTDPIVITTTDGQERKFLLTRGSLKRIRQALKAANIQEVLTKVASDDNGAQAIFFHEALVDKGLTLEQFEDIMPVSLERDMGLIFKLIGASMPTPEAGNGARPTDPLATIQ